MTTGIKKNWVAGRGNAGATGRGGAAAGGRPGDKKGPGDAPVGGGRGNRARGVQDKGGRGRPIRRGKSDRAPSTNVGSEWVVIEEFDLPQLIKLVANKPQIEDLMWCGHLDQYDESYDKVSTRAPRPVRRVENKVFYGVTTTEDPIIEKFAVEGAGNVFATDAILAHLIAAPRSVYSWDIVIQKVDGVLFFDKRAGSQFDLLTVSETANEPPVASEETDEFNFPEKLSLEATMINQNFSQQILKESEDSRKMVSPSFSQHSVTYIIIIIFISTKKIHSSKI